MIAEFIKPPDPKWKSILMNCRHDFYHIPDYVALEAKHEYSEPVAFYAEDNGASFFAPLLIYKVPENLGAPDGWYDALAPYGYPTPIITPGAHLSTLASFLEAFKTTAAECGIISAFFRLHPLIPIQGEVLGKYGTLVTHGQTVYIDLSLPEDEFWAQMDRTHRKDIRRLARSGYRASIDDWDLYDDFISIYTATMRRLSADSFYLFPNSYFKKLRLALGDCLHLCTIWSPSNEIASAGLFTTVNGIAQYHLSGTAEAYVRQSPSKLSYEAIYRYAKQSGNRVFHLGGGVGGQNDSLFEFKAGFSKSRVDYYTYRMVLDHEKYATLTRLWEGQYNHMASPDSDFFPAYRRRLTQASEFLKETAG